MMYHIFTTLPTDMMIELHDVERFPETLNTIESFLFWFIPLSCDNVDFPVHTHISRTGFRQCFQQKLREILESSSSTEDNMVLRIAEFTLDLCKEYLFVSDDVLASRHDLKSTYLPPISFLDDSFKSRDNDSNPFLKSMNDLRLDIFDREELKAFLALSYFYYHTHKDKIEYAEWNDFLNAINPKRKDTDDVSDKLGNFKRYNPPFVQAFLMEPSNSYLGWVNGKLTKQGTLKQTTGILRSILDLPIMTSIIETSAEKWNPFVVNLSTKKRKNSKSDNTNSQESKDKHTDENPKGTGLNLKRYLENYTWMFLCYEVAQKKLDCIETNFSYCTSQIATLYDQFLFERLASINFISDLYDLFETVPDRTIWTLSRFISSPLVNFRLKLIAYHKRMRADEEFRKVFQFISNDDSSALSWNAYLRKMLDYQLNCTLPILELVFHYLFALIRDAHKGEEDGEIEKKLLESMKSYLTKLSGSPSYSFYSKTESGYLVPNQARNSAELFGANNKLEPKTEFKQHLPYLTSNHLGQPPFPDFCREVYLNFFEDIIDRCKNNFFQKMAQNLTKEHLDQLAIIDSRFPCT